MTNQIKYQCCFCGLTIERDSVEPLQVAVINPGATDTLEEQPEGPQYLWCHVDCLASRLHPSVPFLNRGDRLEIASDA